MPSGLISNDYISYVNHLSTIKNWPFFALSSSSFVLMPFKLFQKRRTPTQKAWEALGYILLPHDYMVGGDWGSYVFPDGTAIYLYSRHGFGPRGLFKVLSPPSGPGIRQATLIEITDFNNELAKHKDSWEAIREVAPGDSWDISLREDKTWVKWPIGRQEGCKFFTVEVKWNYKPERGQGIGGSETGGVGSLEYGSL